MSNSLFTLKNDSIFVVAEAAGGVYNTLQIKTICEISEEDSAFLKVTEDERLGFMIPPDKIPEVQSKLAAVGVLLRHYRGQNFGSPKACLGDLCPHAKQDALGAALEMSPQLNEKLKNDLQRISIGINGCSVGCVASGTDDIHIVGHEAGYRIYVGGKSTEIPKISELACEVVNKEQIGEAVFAILETYFQLKQEDEAICDVLQRVGMESFSKCCEPFAPALNSLEDNGLMSELNLPESSGDLDSPSLSADVGEQSLDSDLPPLSADVGEQALDSDPPSLSADVGEQALDSDLPPLPVEEEAQNLDLEIPPLSAEEESQNLDLDLPPLSAEPEKLEDHESEENIRNTNIEEQEGFSDDEEEENPIIMDYDEPPTTTARNIFDETENEANSVGVRPKQRISIKMVENSIAVVLPNGLDFQISNDSLVEGESIEMQLGKEIFVLENLYGKLHIKYGDLEMTIPLINDKNFQKDAA